MFQRDKKVKVHCRLKHSAFFSKKIVLGEDINGREATLSFGIMLRSSISRVGLVGEVLCLKLVSVVYI